MRYPILIEVDTTDTAFGVVVPDFLGCFSAGDTLDEAIDAAKQAASAWIDAAMDSGVSIPKASNLCDVRKRPEYDGWIVDVIDLSDKLADDTIKLVNITLPKRVLRRLDNLARARGQSRGASISKLTLSA